MDPHPATHGRFPYFTVTAVALPALCVTLVVWHLTGTAEERRLRLAADGDLEDLKVQVSRGLDLFHEKLRSARGLFEASDSIERHEWHAYVAPQKLQDSLPEIWDFGYVAFVPRSKREEFLRATRADRTPSFQMHLSGDPDESFIFKYAEPAERNAAALGVDLAMNFEASNAICQTRDTGQEAMTGPMRLLTEPAEQAGVEIHLAIYGNGVPHETVAERRAAFEGTVVLDVRMGDFMRRIATTQPNGWTLRLYDGSEETRDALLFERDSPVPAGESGDLWSGSSEIQFGGRTWLLRATAPLTPPPGDWTRGMVLSIGIFFSLLVTLLAWSLSSTRLRALALADRMHRSEQENADRIRAILDSARDAILTMNEQGLVESMNASACRLFGYELDEVLGRPMTVLMPERYREAHSQGLARHLRTLEVRFLGKVVEVEGRRKDGTVFPIEISASESRVGGRRLFSGIVRDISERKAAQSALQEANQRLTSTLQQLETSQRELIRQERLRAIGTMASGIAHDFNNSLAAILGFTELLLMKPELRRNEEALQSHLNLIRTAANDASAVVARLREFYRHRDTLESESPIQVNRIVEEALSLARPRWKDMAQAKGIDIQTRTQLAPDLPVIHGNETELREVLVNLLFNSVDAMPRGGIITVSTRSDGRRVAVEVEDTGVGMSEEVRQRCLEPFFTTKGPKGTGLGLSVAYGVLKRLQGTIDVQSASGEGTRVRLAIPFRTGATPLPQPSPVAPSAGPLSILVVDDDALVREVLRGYLTAVGHQVELATNGREGLERFHAGRFDLIITDQGMPELTGGQLAMAAKQSAPETPVILLTGWGDQMRAAGERPVGVDLILNKPITPSALIDAVGDVVARARTQ